MSFPFVEGGEGRLRRVVVSLDFIELNVSGPFDCIVVRQANQPHPSCYYRDQDFCELDDESQNGSFPLILPFPLSLSPLSFPQLTPPSLHVPRTSQRANTSTSPSTPNVSPATQVSPPPAFGSPSTRRTASVCRNSPSRILRKARLFRRKVIFLLELSFLVSTEEG